MIMTTDLLTSIVGFKNYFLVVSGSSGQQTLTILDERLHQISEHEFSGIDIWTVDFHVDEGNSKVLLSVVTTETIKENKRRYQGYNTLWFELKESSAEFELTLLETWEKSNIKAFKSKWYSDRRVWISLRESTTFNSNGGKERVEHIGLASHKILGIPRFEYADDLQHTYLSHHMDFEINDDDIFISSIGTLSANVPTIIKINQSQQSIAFIKVDIPIKKRHQLHQTVLKRIDNELVAYFWITSSEYAKKYVFEIYAVKVDRNLPKSTFIKVLDSEYCHSFTWSDRKVVYKTGEGSTPCKLGLISSNGKIIQIGEFEQSHPLLLTDSDLLIALSDDRKKLITIEVGDKSDHQ